MTNALRVLAFDAKTGKKLWEDTPYDGVMFDDRHRKNTYASPTMVTDGTLVYGGAGSYPDQGEPRDPAAETQRHISSTARRQWK